MLQILFEWLFSSWGSDFQQERMGCIWKFFFVLKYSEMEGFLKTRDESRHRQRLIEMHMPIIDVFDGGAGGALAPPAAFY